MDIVTAYTDGSASVRGQNAGKAGYGVYFPNLLGKQKAFSKGFDGKTGEAETTALLRALEEVYKAYSKSVVLLIYSDSEYVVKTISENRLEKWRNNKWHNTAGEVKNLYLWKKIYDLAYNGHITLKMKHIKSHQCDKLKGDDLKEFLTKNPHVLGNMIADKLADYKRFL